MRLWLISLAACAAASPAFAQSWRFSSRADPLDQVSVSTAIIDMGYARGGAVVRCSGDRLEAYVVPAAVYIGDDVADVRYRFDSGEVIESAWDVSTAGDAVFAWGPGTFARGLAQGSRLVFEVTDFSGTPHRTTVPLAGSSGPIHRVLNACGVPVTDPRALDDRVWRRAVDDIERIERGNVDSIAFMLAALGFENVEGVESRTQPLYRALSDFYAAYWALCREEESVALETASCLSWRSRRRYDPQADYTAEPVELLLEVVRAADDGDRGAD